MCVPDVHLVKNGERETVFREVENLTLEGDELVFTNTAGQTYRTRARLREINLVEHVVLLEEDARS
jgi:predicted RNA-binding protein